MTVGNPTLQLGAESPDGWVEYLHILLDEYFYGRKDFSFHAMDGRFTEETKKAVELYQHEKGLHVDGVVGDQTWAALMHHSTVEPIGDDGRAPNTYVEHGKELRFDPGSANGYAGGESDTYILRIVNVGDVAIHSDDIKPFVHVKTPDGSSLNPTNFASYVSYAEPGGWFEIWVQDATNAGPQGRYSLIAQLPMETGGDTFEAEFDRAPAG